MGAEILKPLQTALTAEINARCTCSWWICTRPPSTAQPGCRVSFWASHCPQPTLGTVNCLWTSHCPLPTLGTMSSLRTSPCPQSSLGTVSSLWTSHCPQPTLGTVNHLWTSPDDLSTPFQSPAMYFKPSWVSEIHLGLFSCEFQWQRLSPRADSQGELKTGVTRRSIGDGEMAALPSAFIYLISLALLFSLKCS